MRGAGAQTQGLKKSTVIPASLSMLLLGIFFRLFFYPSIIFFPLKCSLPKRQFNTMTSALCREQCMVSTRERITSEQETCHTALC